MKQFITFEVDCKGIDNLENLINEAMYHYGSDGVNEYQIDEAQIDQILGMEAFTSAGPSEEVISKFEELEFREKISFYFFSDHFENKAILFEQYLEQHHLKFIKRRDDWKNWNESWKVNFKPIVIASDLTILPEWYKGQVQALEDQCVFIHPGMGFGTGGHETTRLCLELFMDLEQKSHITKILDFGCGSGILGISALAKLDQNQVVVDFCDIDKDALDNCLYNLTLNFSDRNLEGSTLVSREKFLPEGKNYDLVFANILEHVLKDELNVFTEVLKKGNLLIISGLLVDQVEDVVEFYKNSFKSLKKSTRGDWSAVLLERL